MLKKHLNPANVIASTALFVALGGTAVAAATLERDSVRAPQIRTDAVRSPEIKKDAVRSPEIVKDAVRTSEIRNEGVNIADISDGAQTALLGDVRIAEEDVSTVQADCGGDNVVRCPSVVELPLSSGAVPRAVQSPPIPQAPEPGRNWLIQAKLVTNAVGADGNVLNHCGLVNASASGPNAVLDEVKYEEGLEAMALSGVVKKRDANPTIAIRCTIQPEDQLSTDDAKITALEVGAVTGP
jgi:hypothetical protein